MGRWEPNAQGRLAIAALELFGEHGYEQTTVAEIAARAGLTERTFFRHYTDKREVLFAGGAQFRESFTSAIASAPESWTPMQVVASAVEAAAAGLEKYAGREFARKRSRVIAATPELRERELIKLADVAVAVAAELRARGVEEPAASMNAELGMAAFRVGFERWVGEYEERSFPELLQEALDSLAQAVI